MPTVNVAIDGSDFYLQGVSVYFPDSWIKGEISGGMKFSPQVRSCEFGAFFFFRKKFGYFTNIPYFCRVNEIIFNKPIIN
jgi:hypothetical protein